MQRIYTFLPFVTFTCTTGKPAESEMEDEGSGQWTPAEVVHFLLCACGLIGVDLNASVNTGMGYG